MKNRSIFFLMNVVSALALVSAPAFAGDTIKVGMIAEMTGSFSDFGFNMVNGAKAYMKEHGDTVAGKKIELIVKDVGGPAPEVAKRLAQELIVKDKVDFIAGLGFTPNALGVAPVVTEAKKPAIIMNAATSIITTKSPYFVRVSMTLPQTTEPMAEWAFKKGYRKVYTLVADYGPGHDSEATFKKAFTQLGGQVVGDGRVPLKNLEFAPYVQRIKDANPQAVFVFLPSGEMPVAFMKAYNERGLGKKGIKLLTTGDVMHDAVQDAIGDQGLGVISSHHYSGDHKSPENKAFLAAFKKIVPQRPNFMAVGGYDGMAAIYEVVRKLNGNIDGDKAIAVLKGFKWNSPRGPVSIDPATREPIQNVYVREVRKIGGHYYNVEIETFEAMKDPSK